MNAHGEECQATHMHTSATHAYCALAHIERLHGTVSVVLTSYSSQATAELNAWSVTDRSTP